MSVLHFEELSGTEAASVRDVSFAIRPVLCDGQLLRACYRFLQYTFDPAVIDPLAFYLSSLSQVSNKSLPTFLAATIEVNQNLIVVGFCSANVMRLCKSPELSIVAIGNIATSAAAKVKGIASVGRQLIDETYLYANEISSRLACDLQLSFVEAQAESLRFWAKLGYLRPAGIHYIQPPLDYTKDGRPIHEPVPEVLLVHPMDGSKSISGHALHDVISTVFEHWYLDPPRQTLRLPEFELVKQYVTSILNGIIPVSCSETLPLTPIC